MKKIRYKVLGYIEVFNIESGEIEKKEELAEMVRDYSESNEAIAKQEAYEGIYNIEDDGEPEPIPEQSQEERIAELEAALDLILSGVTE